MGATRLVHLQMFSTCILLTVESGWNRSHSETLQAFILEESVSLEALMAEKNLHQSLANLVDMLSHSQLSKNPKRCAAFYGYSPRGVSDGVDWLMSDKKL